MKKLVELHHALYRVTDLLPQRESLRKMLRENANAFLTYIIVEECLPAPASALHAGGQAGGENNAENAEFRIKIGAKIEVMQNMLSTVKEVGYCHPVNFEVLQREYKEIEEYFKTKQEEKPEIKETPKTIVQSLALHKKEDDFARVFKDVVALDDTEEEPKLVLQENIVKLVKNSDSAFNERHQAIVDFIKERKEVKSTELATIFSNRFSLKTLQRDLASLIGQKVIDKQGEKRWAVYRMNGYH